MGESTPPVQGPPLSFLIPSAMRSSPSWWDAWNCNEIMPSPIVHLIVDERITQNFNPYLLKASVTRFACLWFMLMWLSMADTKSWQSHEPKGGGHVLQQSSECCGDEGCRQHWPSRWIWGEHTWHSPLLQSCFHFVNPVYRNVLSWTSGWHLIAKFCPWSCRRESNRKFHTWPTL